MAEDKAKSRGKPKTTVKGKRICKTTPKVELYIDYKGDYPLHNAKHEMFAINLLTMKQGEAYIQAGYNQSGENALKSASRLLSANDEVVKRYEYLKQRHNEEMEKRGIISREQMIANAVYAMNCSLGKLPVKKISRHSYTFRTRNWKDLEERDKEKIPKSAGDNGELIEVSHMDFEEQLLHEHDIKAFPAIWDKLMNALDYYPKPNEKNDFGDSMEKVFEKLEGIVKRRFEK